MKKIIPVIVALVCLLAIVAVPVSCISAQASEQNSVPQGAELDDFDVKLSYKNYILYSSGAYRAIEIVFDENFAKENLPAVTENENPEFLTVFTPYLNSLGYAVKIDKNKYSIIGERKYDDLATLYIDMGIDGYKISKNDYITQKSFFFTDTFIKQSSPFTGVEESQGALKKIINEFYELGVQRETILLNYTYGTPYSIINSDADRINFSAGQNIYLHSYDMNMDMANKQINLVQHLPNSANWYALAILISIAVISAPVIFYVKHNKKKKENTYGQ
ncbi:MAG: hypothetical protein GX242_02985 [Clostridiales bacterium]|nr:hypothetical protein [Clostridiales bacterium]